MNHDGGQLAIETNGVTKRFGVVTAVDGVDLDLAPGAHLRVARSQRIGQDDADPAPGGDGQADLG